MARDVDGLGQCYPASSDKIHSGIYNGLRAPFDLRSKDPCGTMRVPYQEGRASVTAV